MFRAKPKTVSPSQPPKCDPSPLDAKPEVGRLMMVTNGDIRYMRAATPHDVERWEVLRAEFKGLPDNVVPEGEKPIVGQPMVDVVHYDDLGDQHDQELTHRCVRKATQRDVDRWVLQHPQVESDDTLTLRDLVLLVKNLEHRVGAVERDGV